MPNAIQAEVLTYKGEPARPIVTVPNSQEATEVFSAFNDLIYTKMLAADKTGDETNYLYGKACENARRIALILAVSRAGDPLRAEIAKEDAAYATKLVGYLISNVIDAVRESMSENTDEKCKKRILKIVAMAGRKGLTRNELTRKTQFIRRSMREEYIADLIDGGEISVRAFSEGHGHGEFLYLTDCAPEE